MSDDLQNTTQDTTFHGKVVLVQPRRGYRFSLDSLLLAHFIDRKSSETLDLCAGCGIVGLLLLYTKRCETVTAVEIDAHLAQLAEKNADLNGLSEKYVVSKKDYRRFSPPSSGRGFELVIANPPYFPAGSGRLNPDDAEAQGRHEKHGRLDDLLAKASQCMTPKGRLALVLPAFRLHELAVKLDRRGLRIKRLRMVHPHPDKNAGQVLIEAVRGKNTRLQVMAPLIVRRIDGEYSEEVEAILAGNWPSLEHS